MSKSSMQGIPGMSAMSDTLDFVKNLWGGMNVPGMGIPGMIMPTLSVEEINKQVSDLKAVESWLTLNMNMLRSTIQALEVQSATISTLQSMGETLSAAVKPSAARSAAAAPAKPMAAEPASQEPAPASTPAPVEPAARGADGEAPTKKQETSGATVNSPLANPAMWWNLLQDQFKQAVDTAMASEKTTAAAKKPVAKATSKAKPAVKKAAASVAAKASKPAKTPKAGKTS